MSQRREYRPSIKSAKSGDVEAGVRVAQRASEEFEEADRGALAGSGHVVRYQRF
jgi:hypothetical protein